MCGHSGKESASRRKVLSVIVQILGRFTKTLSSKWEIGLGMLLELGIRTKRDANLKIKHRMSATENVMVLRLHFL